MESDIIKNIILNQKRRLILQTNPFPLGIKKKKGNMNETLNDKAF